MEKVNRRKVRPSMDNSSVASGEGSGKGSSVAGSVASGEGTEIKKLTELLSSRRKAVKMTFDELSRRTGMPISTLKKVLVGITPNPTFDTVRRICHALGMELNELDGIPSMPRFANEEVKLVERYRKLDGRSKNLVDFVIKNETERCLDDYEQRAQGLLDNTVTISRYISMPTYIEPAAAGSPLDADSSYVRIDYPEDVVPDKADYAVRISGESMEPSITDGSVVFIRRTNEAKNRDIVIAWVDGEGMVCKRMVCKGDRLVRLASDNPEYPDIMGERLNNLRIYGVVVGMTEMA